MTRIPRRLIDAAERAGACPEALAWLREQPRTWRQLVAHRRRWAAWLVACVPECPHMRLGDPPGCPPRAVLSPADRAYVMVRRPDCLVDLTELRPKETTS